MSANWNANMNIRKDEMNSAYKPVGQRGFTMIENIIAIFILVVALLGLLSTSVIVVKADSLGRTMTTATTLAQDKMEALKNTGYADLVSGADTIQSMYARTWTVTDDSPAAGMKTLVVSVGWSLQGSPHDVTVNCIVSGGA
ncbi:MAG: prepilin-type N-terminal cleavage/methylation domain-containing protein [Syntrophobacterales bacterium]|nr:prepilin-type N-terminal cleavage/methylation domain-containing protein [Syntrophobacterales bacterium]